MVGDDPDNAFLNRIHLELGEADELDVVVVEPFRIALAKRLLDVPAGLVCFDVNLYPSMAAVIHAPLFFE